MTDPGGGYVPPPPMDPMLPPAPDPAMSGPGQMQPFAPDPAQQPFAPDPAQQPFVPDPQFYAPPAPPFTPDAYAQAPDPPGFNTPDIYAQAPDPPGSLVPYADAAAAQQAAQVTRQPVADASRGSVIDSKLTPGEVRWLDGSQDQAVPGQAWGDGFPTIAPTVSLTPPEPGGSKQWLIKVDGVTVAGVDAPDGGKPAVGMLREAGRLQVEVNLPPGATLTETKAPVNQHIDIYSFAAPAAAPPPAPATPPPPPAVPAPTSPPAVVTPPNQPTPYDIGWFTDGSQLGNSPGGYQPQPPPASAAPAPPPPAAPDVTPPPAAAAPPPPATPDVTPPPTASPAPGDPGFQPPLSPPPMAITTSAPATVRVARMPPRTPEATGPPPPPVATGPPPPVAPAAPPSPVVAAPPPPAAPTVPRGGEHWIDIPLLDELAKAVDANMNADAQLPAAGQQPQGDVNIPLLVAKEGVQAANDLGKNPVVGAVQAGDTFQKEFVAAVVTPNSNQATAHGVKAVAAAMKFTVQAVRALGKGPKSNSPGASPVPPAQMGPADPDKPPGPATPPNTSPPATPAQPPPPADPAKPAPDPAAGPPKPDAPSQPGSDPPAPPSDRPHGPDERNAPNRGTDKSESMEQKVRQHQGNRPHADPEGDWPKRPKQHGIFSRGKDRTDVKSDLKKRRD